MIELDSKWNESTLRQWAIDHTAVGMVQARQVLSLLDEVGDLRTACKSLEQVCRQLGQRVKELETKDEQ